MADRSVAGRRYRVCSGYIRVGIMTSQHRAVRLLYACGVVALIIAAIRALLATAPDWFSEGVYLASAVAGVSLLAFWGLSELVLRFFQQHGVPAVVVIVAFAAVSVTVLYVVGAAFLGQEKAMRDTWHLLPLFAVMHQLEAVVVFGGAGGAVVALIAGIRQCWRRFGWSR
jgi:hypothetical protein